MKYNNIFLGFLVLMLGLVSCSKDEVLVPKTTPNTIPSIANPDGSPIYTLIKENDNGAFETYIWEAVDFGDGVAPKYEIQLDNGTGDFSAPTVIATTDSLMHTFTVKEMNQHLRDANVMGNMEVGAQVRIKAIGTTQTTLSSPVSFVVKRYIYDDETPIWMVTGAGVEQPVALVLDAEEGVWKSDGSITFKEGSISFINNNVYQDKLFAASVVDYSMEMEGSLISDGTELIPTKAFEYIITLDVEGKTFTVKEDTFYTLTGTAVVNPDDRFKVDGETMELRTHLVAGDFLIKFNSTTPVNYGVTSASDATLIKDGMVVTIASEGDYILSVDADMMLTVEESNYPATMYITGSFAGWDWASEDIIEMIPVHSNPHLFWSIAWFDANSELKFNSVKDWNGTEFAKTGDADANGTYAIGGDNLPSGAEGYKMVIVNLLTQTIQVTDPVIYGQGSAFGNWDGGEFLFVADPVDAKILVSPAAVADDNARMYVTGTTLTNTDGNVVDWWQAEFSVLSGLIEYRGAGDDLPGAPITTGQKVKLNFSDGTGVFE